MKAVLSPIKWVVLSESGSQFCDSLMEIERVEDETWGEVLEIKRSPEDDFPLRISKAEWPSLREAINQAMKHCRVFEEQ